MYGIVEKVELVCADLQISCVMSKVMLVSRLIRDDQIIYSLLNVIYGLGNLLLCGWVLLSDKKVWKRMHITIFCLENCPEKVCLLDCLPLISNSSKSAVRYFGSTLWFRVELDFVVCRRIFQHQAHPQHLCCRNVLWCGNCWTSLKSKCKLLTLWPSFLPRRSLYFQNSILLNCHANHFPLSISLIP